MITKIKTGDKVQIITGKDKTKRTAKGDKTDKANIGKVVQVFKNEDKIVVEGLNLRIKHVRPKKMGESGQKVSYPEAMAVSNVMLVCPKCSKPTRVGFKILDTDKKGSKKIRICRKCNEAIDS